jgi:septal ring factor EnvC (AmiA/AmiB activator)
MSFTELFIKSVLIFLFYVSYLFYRLYKSRKQLGAIEAELSRCRAEIEQIEANIAENQTKVDALKKLIAVADVITEGEPVTEILHILEIPLAMMHRDDIASIVNTRLKDLKALAGVSK